MGTLSMRSTAWMSSRHVWCGDTSLTDSCGPRLFIFLKLYLLNRCKSDRGQDDVDVQHDTNDARTADTFIILTTVNDSKYVLWGSVEVKWLSITWLSIGGLMLLDWTSSRTAIWTVKCLHLLGGPAHSRLAIVFRLNFFHFIHSPVCVSVSAFGFDQFS